MQRLTMPPPLRYHLIVQSNNQMQVFTLVAAPLLKLAWHKKHWLGSFYWFFVSVWLHSQCCIHRSCNGCASGWSFGVQWWIHDQICIQCTYNRKRSWISEWIWVLRGLVKTMNNGDIIHASFSRKHIPRATHNFFGRLKIIEHVQLFCFGCDCLYGYDPSSCLELLSWVDLNVQQKKAKNDFYTEYHVVLGRSHTVSTQSRYQSHLTNPWWESPAEYLSVP